MKSELLDHLQKFPTNPYLFIGSGLSRRYIGLPTWESLLSEFFSSSFITGELEYFQSKSNGSLPKLAELLALEFHEVWWKNANFKTSREINKIIAKEKSNIPLKIEISNLIQSKKRLNKEFEEEIALLKTSVIDGIITTNWDTFLETIFNDFKIFVGQQELLFSECISIGEIYKIHGCVSRPQSLIITEEDYKDFNERNAYLAAKMLTIFVEHPVIFIGYSLSDENIQQIIDSIVNCVEAKNLDKLKDRLIFVEWQKDSIPQIKDSSIKLPGNKVLPIKLIKTDSFKPIFETLNTLTRKIPIPVLRKLKNAVVELVKTSKPTSKIFVSDIDSLTDTTNIEYAIGIGVAQKLITTQGYKAIEAIDIIEDVLFSNKNYDACQLLESSFPKMLKGNGYIPVYKYLRAENYLTKAGLLTSAAANKFKNMSFTKAGGISAYNPPKSYLKKTAEIRRNHLDVKSITKSYDAIHSLNFIPLLEQKNIDTTQLLPFLRNCFKDESLKKNSQFRKVVCLYDYLNYGLQ